MHLNSRYRWRNTKSQARDATGLIGAVHLKLHARYEALQPFRALVHTSGL